MNSSSISRPDARDAKPRLKPECPKPTLAGEGFGILNPFGQFWTHQTFTSEQWALHYIADFWRGNENAPPLSDFKVIPVRITVSEKLGEKAREGEGADRPGEPASDRERLHPDTARLVATFADALAAKLRRAEEKYGYTNGWLTDDWEADLRRDLAIHVAKGDPLDVAIYAAFAWARGYRTAPEYSPVVISLFERWCDDMLISEGDREIFRRDVAALSRQTPRDQQVDGDKSREAP
jgi:hypothetical protein